jgi:hypothetical protein
MYVTPDQNDLQRLMIDIVGDGDGDVGDSSSLFCIMMRERGTTTTTSRATNVSHQVAGKKTELYFLMAGTAGTGILS